MKAARDDYPELAATEGNDFDISLEATRALDEIDELRVKVRGQLHAQLLEMARLLREGKS